MSFDAVRAAFFDTLKNELAGKIPGVLIHFENQKFDQPEGPWVSVSLVLGDSKRAEIASSRLFHHHGGVVVNCMVPQDTGTKRLHDITQAVFEVLADRNWSLPGEAGRLTTYCCKRRNRGLINGFQTYNIQTEFRHDARHG